VRNLDPARARWIRTRMGVLCGVMALGLGGIVSSAWRVQVEDGPEWREMAEKQRQRRLHVDPKRGTIYDRNGTPLAVSIEVPSVSADMAEMLRTVDGKPAQEAVLRDASVRIGQVLALDPAEVYAKLEPRHRFVWLKRRITGDEAAAVRDLGDAKLQARPIRGLTIEGEGHRYYPGRELAGSVLGFVAPDGQGKDGLELALDEEASATGADASSSRGPARATRSRATTSRSPSTKASSTSRSASSTPRCVPTRRRARPSSSSIPPAGRSSP